jgi:hypothetical protein
MPPYYSETPSLTPTHSAYQATTPNPTPPITSCTTSSPNSNQPNKWPEAEWLWDSFGNWTSYEEGNANNFWANGHSQFPQMIKNETFRREQNTGMDETYGRKQSTGKDGTYQRI